MSDDGSKSTFATSNDLIGTTKLIIRSKEVPVLATDWNNSEGGQLSVDEEASVTYVSGQWYTNPHSDEKEADPQNWHGPGGNGVPQVSGNGEGALIVAIRPNSSKYRNEQEQFFTSDKSVINIKGPGVIIFGCADDDRNDNLGTIKVLVQVTNK